MSATARKSDYIGFWVIGSALAPRDNLTSGLTARFPSGRALPGSEASGAHKMPPKANRISPEFVTRFLKYAAYDPETGRMWWIKSKKKVVVGSEVGNTPKTHENYRASSFEYQKFLVHRMAWTIVHGEIPEGMQVDHINGNRHDNRMCNLRLLTNSQNGENKHKAMAHSKSGLLGVSWDKPMKAWVARIKTPEKYKVLGYFQDKHEAHQAYLEAKRRLHPGCTI